MITTASRKIPAKRAKRFIGFIFVVGANDTKQERTTSSHHEGLERRRLLFDRKLERRDVEKCYPIGSGD